ncbi:MAG: ApaG protein [Marivirga sp.]|jgi:ApaG protein
MVKLVTEGISISVETSFQEEYSSPAQNHYVFTYKVSIENKGQHTVQLLRRQWYIHDAGQKQTEVEGEGVVGAQPVLEPGQKHEYVSGSNLKSPFGKMLGYYTMERVVDGHKFQVQIPEFNLIADYKLN